MSRILKCILLALYSLSLTSLHAQEKCQGYIQHKIDAQFENGEPSSVLIVRALNEERSFTIPFQAENSTCKKIDGEGIIKISVVTDRPRLELVYYFNVGDKFEYIGNASITTSSGEEQVSGISEVNKGDSGVGIDLQNVNGEDAAIISKIINVKYNPNVNKKTLDLYNDMRYIEIDALSEINGSKICDDTERVFFYCKAKSGKVLNLCYSPFSGNITYNYGRYEKELSIDNFSLNDNRFVFENGNTSYNVNLIDGEILVSQGGEVLSLISCR
ncbi:MAG: hypothetical protein ACRDCI_09450 [Plesiomonas shigelloides]